MIGFLADFGRRFLEQVIGTNGTNGIYVATFLLLIVLMGLLVMAHFPVEIAFVITSPLILTMSLLGWLPPVTLGVAILLLALFWTGIILAIAGNK